VPPVPLAAASQPEFLRVVSPAHLEPVAEQSAAGLQVAESGRPPVVFAAAVAQAGEAAGSHRQALAVPAAARARRQAVLRAEVPRQWAAPAAEAGAPQHPVPLVSPASAAAPDLSDWD